MNRNKEKNLINPPKKATEEESSVNTVKIKRTIARICCLRLKPTWSIRTQFMSSIFILNLIFLALIIASILGVLIGLGVLLLNLTQEKIQTRQLDGFQAWSVEKSEAIANKISYYSTVTQYFGKLIQGMTLQDASLFQSPEYPLNQPDSTSFPDLPTWSYTLNPVISLEVQNYYLSNSLALNYFARSLLTPFEDIPILRLYATFVSSDRTPILTLGYPDSSTFEIPDTTKSNWYTKALSSSTSYAWSIGTINAASSPVFRISQRFNKADGSTLVVTCVELNLTHLQYHTIDQFNYNTKNITTTLLLDVWGNILLSSSSLGDSFLTSLPQITKNPNNTYTVLASEWLQTQRVAELQDSDTFTWIDNNQESYHISASKLDLLLDPSDTIYVMHLYAATTALGSMDALSTKLWDQSLSNVLISGFSVLGAFLIMAIMSFFRARSFLEPLRIISNYSSQKSQQTINNDADKEIKPIKIPNGEDEIGDFVDAFKKLVQGLPASEEKEHKGIESYPKNYLKGKTMPWREKIKSLNPQKKDIIASKEVVKEKTTDNILSWLHRNKN